MLNPSVSFRFVIIMTEIVVCATSSFLHHRQKHEELSGYFKTQQQTYPQVYRNNSSHMTATHYLKYLHIYTYMVLYDLLCTHSNP